MNTIADSKTKAPLNKKYKNIQGKVDTGNSATKYIQELNFKASFHKRLPNELFKRMKPLTFARMIMEIGYEMDLESFLISLQTHCNSSNRNSLESGRPAAMNYVSNFINSKVNLNDSIDDNVEVSSSGVPSLPFLLLDCRPFSLYSKSHLITAKHFDPLQLQRSSQFSYDIIKYRNTDNLIIIYDDDESIAVDSAQQLALRDVSNVWILSGGLKLLSRKGIDGIFSDTGFNHSKLVNSIMSATPDLSTIRSETSRITNKSTIRPFH